MKSHFLFLVSVITSVNSSFGFSSMTQPQLRLPTTALFDSELTDKEYLIQLQEAAKDPKTFEEFIKNGRLDAKKKKKTPKPGAYQRIEEWDAEQERKRADMSWEERVQFDGQRFGDKFKQNSILKRNLNGF